jgi:hypothetical protein
MRDVLYDQPLDASATRFGEPPAPGLAVLDFYDDANLDFSGFDFALLDHWNVDPSSSSSSSQLMADQTHPPSTNTEDPAGMAAMRAALVKMWSESPWYWTPPKTDNCYVEQPNLPLPLPHGDAHRVVVQARDGSSRAVVDRVVKDTLQSACRDKILAIVLGTCRDNGMAGRVAASFPSAELMDSWINIFLAEHLCKVSSWIHYGSFAMNSQWPEWLAMAAAAGAILTPVPTFRRFGFALQEAVRECVPCA